MKTLVLYHFWKQNQRVDFFVKHGIFHDPNVDFIIISNSNEINFEVPPYVKTLKRKNIGYDFGGWSDALLNNNLYKGYTHFIFINCSVFGPFVKGTTKKWTDFFIEGLKDNIGIFGSTINCPGQSISIKDCHVQSYAFTINKTILEYLMKNNIFTKRYARTMREAIWKERSMTKLVCHIGKNIGCLIPCLKDFNFINPNKFNMHDRKFSKNTKRAITSGEIQSQKYLKPFSLNVMES